MKYRSELLPIVSSYITTTDYLLTGNIVFIVACHVTLYQYKYE